MWERAREIAENALNGYVMTAVGTATHYHAYYVRPYWSPSLSRIVQIGAHIFYRATNAGQAPGTTGDGLGRRGLELDASISNALLQWTSASHPAHAQTRRARRTQEFSFRVESPEPLSDDENRSGKVVVLGR
jgi:hypothetical protein